MRRVIVGLFTVAALTGAARTATAGCTTTLDGCYYEASRADRLWDRWAAELDCRIDFIECVRVRMMGR